MAHLDDSLQRCYETFQKSGIDPYPPKDHRSWCSATFDTVLCWPPIPAGTNYSLQCPPLKGLDPTKRVTKICGETGRWQGRNETDFSKPYGWTNYTECYAEKVIEIMQKLSSPFLKEVQKLARNARLIELVGYGLSILALLIVLGLYLRFRRLRLFRNMIHICTMVALLIVGTTRFVLFLDITTQWGMISKTPIACNISFFVLEYGKICVIAWIFLETFYVHNRICWNICKKKSFVAYIGFGYLLPFINASFWLISLWEEHKFKLPDCLGDYYLRSLLILSLPKLITNTLTMLMLLNIVRVLLCHYKNYVPTVEYRRIKIHIIIAFFLFILVAIPEVLHMHSVSPFKNGILTLKIYTYSVTIAMVLQGIIVAVIFLLLNKEVLEEFKDLSWRRKNSKMISQNMTITESTQAINSK